MASAKHSFTPAENEGLTRRHLLRAAPAVGLAALATCATPVDAATETPVAALFREWLRLDAEEAAIYAADPDGNDPACEEATDRKLAVERQMRDAPKLTLADLGLAVMVTTEFGSFGTPVEVQWAYRAEARELVGA